jgi:predicted HTH transcriptional regulator
VGFLNTQGGTLLVGVSDKGEVIGIEADSFNSKDSYLLHFRNTINTRIGAEYYPHIDYEIVDIMGKMVLKVFCRPSSKPCFYEKKEFFVRTNPATDKLEGQQLIEYINQHF